MSEIERKWWYLGPVTGVAVYLAYTLLAAAGLPIARYGAYQWTIFFLCFVGIKQTLSLLIWFVLLFAAPSLVRGRR